MLHDGGRSKPLHYITRVKARLKEILKVLTKAAGKKSKVEVKHTQKSACKPTISTTGERRGLNTFRFCSIKTNWHQKLI